MASSGYFVNATATYVRRRDLGFACGALFLARGAQAGVIKTLGLLAPAPLRPIASFKRRLDELGWIEGRTIRFEERWAEGDDSRYVTLAAELAAVR